MITCNEGRFEDIHLFFPFNFEMELQKFHILLYLWGNRLWKDYIVINLLEKRKNTGIFKYIFTLFLTMQWIKSIINRK